MHVPSWIIFSSRAFRSHSGSTNLATSTLDCKHALALYLAFLVTYCQIRMAPTPAQANTNTNNSRRIYWCGTSTWATCARMSFRSIDLPYVWVGEEVVRCTKGRKVYSEKNIKRPNPTNENGFLDHPSYRARTPHMMPGVFPIKPIHPSAGTSTQHTRHFFCLRCPGRSPRRICVAGCSSENEAHTVDAIGNKLSKPTTLPKRDRPHVQTEIQSNLNK